MYITASLGTSTTLSKLIDSKCLTKSKFEFKYIINTNSNNQITVTESKLDKKSNNVVGEVQKTIFEVNEKGELKTK